MNELYKCFNPEFDNDLFEELSNSENVKEENETNNILDEFNY